jgi:hypothetical protein
VFRVFRGFTLPGFRSEHRGVAGGGVGIRLLATPARRSRLQPAGRIRWR